MEWGVERARREATRRGTRPRAAAGMPRVQAPRGQPRVRAGPGRRLVHHAECQGPNKLAPVRDFERDTQVCPNSAVVRTRQMAAVQRLALRLALRTPPARLRRLLSSAVRALPRRVGQHIRRSRVVC